VSIQNILGLGGYSTAWTWLHKLRRAMVRPARDRLEGRVEIAETFVGGSEADMGRRIEHKSIVLVAAEENGSGIGRIRLARIPDTHKKTLHHFIQNAVARGATLNTDGLVAYRGLDRLGYTHHATALVREKDVAAAPRLLPRVHRVASLLKRWLLGTHQGAVHAEHLDYYLDEFTFRFNRRKSRSRGKLFYRLLQQAVQIEPVPYHTLIGGSENANQNI
jgi:transposase-like protein